MTGAGLGWVVVLALAGVPLLVVTVASQLRKRGIWTAGKDNNEHRGGGGGGGGSGGGCGGGGCGGGGN
jgi:hypothetical protein